MVFVATLWIFHPSLVVELAHLRVQTLARRSTVMRRPYSSVCRLRNVSVVAALCFADTAYSCSQFYNEYHVWSEILNRCLHPSASYHLYTLFVFWRTNKLDFFLLFDSFHAKLCSIEFLEFLQ
jgi:hypothetical protein